MGKYQKVTEKMFKAVKIMLKSGATNVEIAEYMEISDSTVSNIKNSETYEEYKQRMYTSSGAYRKRMAAMKAAEEKKKQEEEFKKKVDESPVQVKQEEEPKQYFNPTVVRIEATHFMMEEMKKANETLKLISNKLAFIVDELTGEVKK